MTRPSTGPAPGTPRAASDEPPPFWARWGRIYFFVFALLLVETVVFWLLTRWAS